MIPKVELHRHLEGSVRFGTWLEIAREAKIELPSKDPRILKKRLTVNHRTPRTLAAFLEKFTLLRNLYPSRECIERVAREAVEDARRDGIIHLELRFSPVHFARRMKFDAVECAGWIIGAAKKAAGPMSVRFIITLGRDFSADENAPSMDAARVHAGDVVGIDVAGNESVPLTHLEPLLRCRGDLPLTIHAGEGKGPASIREALRLGAVRLGHGVRAVEDPSLVDELLERGIVMEYCITSNRQTGAWKAGRNHPLREHLHRGLRVTLNTDDPSISGITLEDEFKMARRLLKLQPAEMKLLTLNAVDGAFLPDRERQALRDRLVSC